MLRYIREIAEGDKQMEKIKDILHDFSDVFIALVITGLMLGVVAWNLGDWFGKDNIASAIDAPPIEDNRVKEPQKSEPVNEVDKKDENQEVSEEIVDAEEKTEDESSETESSQEESQETPVKVIATENKTITIPNGTPGIGIARILLENGLIENTQDFVQTAENLGLALKLKSGTFQIPFGATTEEIIKIISK